MNENLANLGTLDFIGTSTGNAEINFNANDYLLLYANIFRDNSSHSASIPIISSILSSTIKQYDSGCMIGNNSGIMLSVCATNSQLWLGDCRLVSGGSMTDISSSCTLSVYGIKK